QHPDEFIVHLLDLAPGLVIEAARRHRESLRNPAKTTEEYLEMLEGEGLTETVSVLRTRAPQHLRVYRSAARRLHGDYRSRLRERCRSSDRRPSRAAGAARLGPML